MTLVCRLAHDCRQLFESQIRTGLGDEYFSRRHSKNFSTPPHSFFLLEKHSSGIRVPDASHAGVMLSPANAKNRSCKQAIFCIGWGTGTRTPIPSSRGMCPTIRRFPIICVIHYKYCVVGSMKFFATFLPQLTSKSYHKKVDNSSFFTSQVNAFLSYFLHGNTFQPTLIITTDTGRLCRNAPEFSNKS